MERDLITPTERQNAADGGQRSRRTARRVWNTSDIARETSGLVLAIALGLLLFALLYQVPATHDVDIGGSDEAYVQGFYDPETASSPLLQGSDGSARWSRDVSYLLFPQIGLPAQATLRLRGRPGSAPGEAVIVLNGTHELGRFALGSDWQEHTVAIDGGLLKPTDVVLEIRAPAAPLNADDQRPVGVLLDQVVFRTRTLPIAPYPTQLLYGALAAGMLFLLTRRTQNAQAQYSAPRSWLSRTHLLPFAVALLLLSFAFLFLYRLQPLYPYPLRRLLPLVDLALAAALALRYGALVVRRIPALFDALALGGIGSWTIAILLAARDHLALSLPGVENDFSVFARRSAQLAGRLLPGGVYSSAEDGVFRADGFYNLGYPLLLWLVRPFTHDNPFLAGRLIAALSGALLLGATWWLARRLLGAAPALLALAILALSPLAVEYGLYLGSDMPFAALCALALALLIGRRTKNQESRTHSRLPLILAGFVAGAAFLARHPGLLLLPFGWLVIWSSSRFSVADSEVDDTNSKFKTQNVLLFTLAFVLAIAPQLYVNVRDTGQPLYNQQAKNIWLCVYGSCDWGRWDEAPNTITFSEVLARAPGRFLAHWWANVRGYLGAGGEDTSEFGHAIQLRLLGFPANWLALGGLLAWMYVGFAILVARLDRTGNPPKSNIQNPKWLLLAWIAIYVLTVSVGISLPRFFLPLAPVYAIAAAWAVARLTIGEGNQAPFTHHASRSTHHLPLLAALLLLALLWNGFATGANYVLRNQDAGDVAAVQLVQATLRPGERLEVRAPPRVLLGKYSALAHLVVAADGQYLLALEGESPAASTIVGTTGQYTLYRLTP